MNDQTTKTEVDPAILAIRNLLARSHSGAWDNAMKGSIERRVGTYIKKSALEEALREIDRYSELYSWDTTQLISKARADLRSCLVNWELAIANPDDDIFSLPWALYYANAGLEEVEKARKLAVERMNRQSYQLGARQALLLPIRLFFRWLKHKLNR